jgi:WD40 repeat protein
MTAQEALVILDTILAQRLSDIQALVFRQCWEGKSYQEIADGSNYDPSYIKDVGYKLWQLLSQALGERVTKSNVQSVVRRNLPRSSTPPLPTPHSLLPTPHLNWGEAIDTTSFYGREAELDSLKRWVIQDRCRLIAVLGMGGIGKTALSVKLAEQLQGEFDYLVWRSLLNAPPVEEILADLIRFLSNEQETEPNLPKTVVAKVARLIHYLRSSRCLLVLDNVETILQGGDWAGHYREDYEGYGELLRCVAEVTHQSCLIVTSREKPREVAFHEGEVLPVRSLLLSGLQSADGQKIFATKGTFRGADEEWKTLIQHYAGNPLALKMVAPAIQELFDGSIPQFLELLQSGTLVFDDIRDLLERQFNRLSEPEKEVMYWLAINREFVSLAELREDIVSAVSKRKLPEVLQSLGRRSLTERALVTVMGKRDTLFTQQPVVMEYMTEKLIEHICQEIETEAIDHLMSYTLLKAQAKDYIRESQIRTLLKPLAERLRARLKTEDNIEFKLNQVLTKLQDEFALAPGYGGGNLINLLQHFGINLSNYDFSNLAVWQAYLPYAVLQNVNFAQADLAKSVFAEVLGIPLAIALSPDGRVLVVGDANGEIHLWQIADGTKLFTYRGHNGWIWSVAFSPISYQDQGWGELFASASEDHTIKLWDAATGRCVRTLQGHAQQVWSVKFSLDGKILATASEDHTVKLWDVETGACLKTLQGHRDWVRAVAFSPDGQFLASGSSDRTIKLWDMTTGQCLKTLEGHTSRVWSVAFSPLAPTPPAKEGPGGILASGSDDNHVKVWDVTTGQCLQTLVGHTNWVRAIAFSSDGQTLASGSEDHTIRLWHVSTGECFKLLNGHTNWVRAIAYSADGQVLISASGDNSIKQWEVKTGQCIKTLQGYTSRVWAIAFNPDGQTLASGNDDHTVRLWKVGTGQCIKTLQKHTNQVRSMAFSPDGQTLALGSGDHLVKLLDIRTGECHKVLRGHTSWAAVTFSPDGQILASGSGDHTVKLWDVRTGQCLRTLREHTSRVWSVSLNPTGRILASGDDDGKIKLWDIHTGQCIKTLEEHTNWVWAVAFSPTLPSSLPPGEVGEILASGSGDHTVKLWDTRTGACFRTLEGHTSRVWSVAFSPDGKLLASGSSDQTVKLWDVATGECLKTLTGHTNLAWTVAFSPVGNNLSASDYILASGSQDETIRLWNSSTGECIRTLKADKPYEHMNIANIKGLTEAQKMTLKALGAIEDDDYIPKSRSSEFLINPEQVNGSSAERNR